MLHPLPRGEVSTIPRPNHSGKAALYWIVDRFRLTVDKESGIVSDPNEFSDDPRYIIDLIKRVVTVSICTLEIVGKLPTLSFDKVLNSNQASAQTSC